MKFAQSIIRSASLSSDAIVADPWNGGGTTTAAALGLGYNSVGIDINPVMVVVAKARSLSFRDKGSLNPIATDIIDKARRNDINLGSRDPLTHWFVPRSAYAIRRIEAAIERLLIEYAEKSRITDPVCVEPMSDLAAFYYVALFRTVRELLANFFASNPTWLKRPDPRSRIRPSNEDVFSRFRSQVELMVEGMDRPHLSEGDAIVELPIGSSEQLPLPAGSIDLILTSPPYCTRIDYAVATMAELAVLRFDPDRDVPTLRRKMLGTSTVPAVAPAVSRNWGESCNTFLHKVQNHPSKASRTYYYKSHTQYFNSIFRSLSEIDRVLKPGARCVMVVQDSFYKDVHNNLPVIVTEMMEGLGIPRIRRFDFKAPSVMANVHPSRRAYRSSSAAIESVLCFQKR